MKILFVTNMYPGADDPAAGVFVKEQIDDLVRLGGVDPHVHVVDGIGKGKRAYLESVFRVPRIVRRGGYDLVHVHYGIAAMFLLVSDPDVPVVLTLHGSDILEAGGHPAQVWITRRILPRVDTAFVVSRHMESRVRPLARRCEWLPCGVDADFFRPPGSAPPRPDGTRLIVFPNSPRRADKNYPLFRRTLDRLSGRSEFELVSACVEGLSREGVRDLLGRADCLLMTSRSEGSPQLVKEALACGTPVVSNPVGDVRTLVDGVPASHVAGSMDDPEALGRLVLRSLRADAPRECVRRAFLAKGAYTREAVAKTLLGHYAREVRRA